MGREEKGQKLLGKLLQFLGHSRSPPMGWSEQHQSSAAVLMPCATHQHDAVVRGQVKCVSLGWDGFRCVLWGVPKSCFKNQNQIKALCNVSLCKASAWQGQPHTSNPNVGVRSFPSLFNIIFFCPLFPLLCLLSPIYRAPFIGVCRLLTFILGKLFTSWTCRGAITHPSSSPA